MHTTEYVNVHTCAPVSFSKEGMEGPRVTHRWVSGRAGMGPSPDPLWAEKWSPEVAGTYDAPCPVVQRGP